LKSVAQSSWNWRTLPLGRYVMEEDVGRAGIDSYGDD
jgi:hypothetical protein